MYAMSGITALTLWLLAVSMTKATGETSASSTEVGISRAKPKAGEADEKIPEHLDSGDSLTLDDGGSASSGDENVIPAECQQASLCATSFEELQKALRKARRHHTIGLCSDIRVSSTPISVGKTGITLVGCCTETKCVVQGQGSTQNIVATGGDFTLLNVAVRDGQCTSSSNSGGANLSFRSKSGSLTVRDSEFANGKCSGSGGGNVDVSTTGSVTFQNTSFRNGFTNQGWSGGGAFVYRSQNILVDNCEFDGNDGGGIGMYGDQQDISYLAVIRNSKFSDNEGGTAGGIFYSDFGRMQRLEVLNTEFVSNTSTDSSFAAGAAQVSQGIQSGPSTFLWQDNFGSENSGMCPGASHNGECFAVDTTFSPS